MMKILYSTVDITIPSANLRGYLDELPDPVREELSRYKVYQELQSRLVEKLLLKEGLSKYIDGDQCLERIKYNKFGKPYLPNTDIHFSLTHSGRYVALGIAWGMDVGIDIEEMKELEISEFENAFSENEWINIVTAKSPLEKFYSYWTQKESAAKADGRGLTIPLNDIQVERNISIINNKKWFLTKINLDPHYSAHIACEFEEPVEVEKVELFNPEKVR